MPASDIRALVIEDEQDSALLLSTTLEYGGIEHWSANSAEAALQLLPDISPNVLLVDLNLPGIDGWEFLRQVRANPKTADIPAVVVSAYITPTVAREALAAGFAACIPKPLDTNSFVPQLVEIVGA